MNGHFDRRWIEKLRLEWSDRQYCSKNTRCRNVFESSLPFCIECTWRAVASGSCAATCGSPGCTSPQIASCRCHRSKVSDRGVSPWEVTCQNVPNIRDSISSLHVHAQKMSKHVLVIVKSFVKVIFPEEVRQRSKLIPNNTLRLYFWSHLMCLLMDVL